MGKLKKFLKRFLPLPARWSLRQNEQILARLEAAERNINTKTNAQIGELTASVSVLHASTEQLLRELAEKLQSIESSTKHEISTLAASTEQRIAELAANTEQRTAETASDLQMLKSETQNQSAKLSATSNIVNEILWANIFNSTTDITGIAMKKSEWLVDKTFTPGRWAAGYPFLFIIYRVLRDTKPRRILELGLGETTKLISQYAAQNRNVEHFVAEHNPEWAGFFSETYSPPENTKIVQLPWGYKSYENAEKVRVYDGFAERFANGKYDLICVDGPLGVDMKEYSRIDILDLLPENLEDSFVILLDDYERPAEQKTAEAIMEKLRQTGIAYSKGVYSGQKSTLIICSEDVRFLASL